MVFSNLFFVYLFLPLCLLIYFISFDIKAKNVILIFFSLAFYSWGGFKYLPVLIAMTFINWLFGIFISKCKSDGKKKWLLAVSCAISLGLLGFYKYTGFIMETFISITKISFDIPEIIMPIGISFYTFQLISYTVDVYRKEVPAQKNFFTLLLYSSLFHQCIAGPIIRYKDISDEFNSRKVTLEDFADGIARFSVGLAKKALLANYCGSLADTLLSADNLTYIGDKTSLALWAGVLFYMFQIYFDFSAYSDMAIGMGRMFGFHYLENFKYPYISKNVTEFWRRWHISLSIFFRDYVYIPLGGNRKGILRTVFNLFVVWFLTGLWHGASWNFVVWGLYFFVFILLEKLFLKKKVLDKIPGIFSHLYLLCIVFFGWILFRFNSMETIGIVIKGMFCGNGNLFTDLETNTILLNNIFFLMVCMLAVTPFGKNVAKAVRRAAEKKKLFFGVMAAMDLIYPSLMIILSTMALVGNSYNPFLYFQF